MGRGLSYPLSKYINIDVGEAGTISVNIEQVTKIYSMLYRFKLW